MRLHLLAATVPLCFPAVLAQQPAVSRLEPVHWSANASLPTIMQPGSRFAATLHASIDPGWHLYALPERDAFPLATEVALAQTSEADLLRVEEEKPRRSMDPDSHVLTAWFAQSATFTLRLAATTQHPPHDLQVLVRYQACNERMCLPPTNQTVTVQLSLTR